MREAASAAGLSSSYLKPHAQSDDSVTPSKEGLSISQLVIPPRQRRQRPYATGTPKLVPDPFQYLAVNTPPPDMLPYLGNGAYCFAGRIFWAVLEMTMDSMYELCFLEPADPGLKPFVTIKPRSGFHRVVERLDPATPSRITYLSALSEAQMTEAESAQAGDSTISSLATDNSDKIVRSSWWLSQLIERERVHYETADRVPVLTLAEVEKRVRHIVGDDVFSVISRAAIDSMQKQESDKTGGVLLEGLLSGLGETFMCFGNGPCWNARDFDAVLRKWLSSIAPEALAEFI